MSSRNGHGGARRRAITSWLAAVACGCQFFCASTPSAEEVQLRHGELRLNATLDRAADASLTDGVVLITHGTMLHKNADTPTGVAAALVERGFNVLRHTLSLGIDDRRGQYLCGRPHRHRHEDAVHEIAAWVAWLQAQGVTKVVLLGHSRGAAQAAWYAMEHANPAVRGLVLLGPSTRAFENRYINRDLAHLDTARRALGRGSGSVTHYIHAPFINCPGALVTPESYVSYYGPDRRRDTPSLVYGSDLPTLVIAADEDTIVGDIAPEFARYGAVQVEVIEGADHFFRDLVAEDVADLVETFLAERVLE